MHPGLKNNPNLTCLMLGEDPVIECLCIPTACQKVVQTTLIASAKCLGCFVCRRQRQATLTLKNGCILRSYVFCFRRGSTSSFLEAHPAKPSKPEQIKQGCYCRIYSCASSLCRPSEYVCLMLRRTQLKTRPAILIRIPRKVLGCFRRLELQDDDILALEVSGRKNEFCLADSKTFYFQRLMCDVVVALG